MNLEMTEKKIIKNIEFMVLIKVGRNNEDIHPADILDAIHENENEVGKNINRLPEWDDCSSY